MSEQKQPFMAQLNAWTNEFIIDRLVNDSRDIPPSILDEVKYSIRLKVLESYRNGQAAGPRPAQRAGKSREAAKPRIDDREV